MKERATFTIEKSILEKIDNLIDGSSVKNRSHAVELMLLKALGDSSPKIAVILAGGKGTRLKPITHEIPKPLVLVQGKPVLEYNIELMRMYDIRNIIISIGYRGDKIKEYFGDGRKLGVNITYVEEKEPLGTAGPLKLAEHLLTDSFVLCNGDELKDINLHEMFNFHKDNKARGTIALTTVEDPSRYGVANLEGNKILDFIEKPTPGNAPSNLINSGLYILEPETIKLVKNTPCSIEKDIFPILAERGNLFGYPFSGQWFDTGTLERYENAIKNWKGFKLNER
ncbi:MAG: nucleotidyltransferase family protein [Nanoarchaeota archaeon]|nr:nucleotidyltransferase family protein [Nanoarchaeota archaeon]